MKKIVLVMLSLCILAGLQATPTALQKKDAVQLVNNTKSHITHVAKPANAGKVATPQFEVMRMQQSAPIAAARKVAMADTLALTINSESEESEVYYLGNYFYWYVYEEWLGDYWDLFMETKEGYSVMLQFVGPSNNRIEGNYRGAYAMISQGNDTIDAFGSLSIKYLSAGTVSSPTYTFSGTFVAQDESEQVFTLSGTYAFPSQSVIDLGIAFACEDGEEEYCGQEDIILIDAPVTPTGDTIPVQINGWVTKHYTKDEGWEVIGDDVDKELMFEVQIFTETLEGTYTDPDLFNMSATKLLDYGAEEYIELKSINGAEISKDPDGNYSFEFFALGLDGYIYDITMQYTYPIPAGDTIAVEILGGTFSDEREDYGIIVAEGFDEKKTYYFSSAVWSDELTGEFTELDSYGSDMNMVVALNGKDTIYYMADRFELQVDTMTYQGDLWFIFQMVMVGVNDMNPSDVRAFNVYFQGLEPDPFEYDAETGVVKTISVNPDELFDASKFESTGIVSVMYKNTKVQFYGMVMPTELDAETILPVGEYPVTEDMTAPCVVASPGYDDSKGAYPTYYATLVQQGGKTYLNDLWFMRSGKMTMSADKMVFNGKNSKGQPMGITFKFLKSDLRQVLQDAKLSKLNKVMIKNQLYILREGKAYNSFGQNVK
ncbi:MAG: hypothetical protein MJZ65_05140 [Paludibacteraceae bacterium]|nr:hypothetical protein [Paludibacteraceae bacterium]